MTLSAQRTYGHFKHTLGGSLSSMLAEQDVANEAGHWLVNVHPWRWLERFLGNLNLRATFSLTGCTWTEATKTLTKASGFSTYSYLRGDLAQITAGTGATPDYYLIASRTDANNIVLDTSIGAAANGMTNIAATIDASGIALPSDFASLTRLETPTGGTARIALTTLGELLTYKQSALGGFPGSLWVALAWSPPLVGGGGVVPRLESWPGVSSNQTAGVKLAYRAGWKTLTNDPDLVSLPESGWLDSLYIRVARAFARGYMREEQGSVGERLDAILASSEFAAAVRRDSSQQIAFGPLRNGAIGSMRPSMDVPSRFTVNGPS